MITREQFAKLSSITDIKEQEAWVNAINMICPKYGIDNVPRIAMFMAQCGHESGGFKFMIENLNYSTDGLLKTFPKYFNLKSAAAYARMPEKIASRVYASRMGNGDEASKDGWKFRGRGILQITGKDNYTKLATSLMINLDDCIKYLETIPGAVESACWFFQVNNLLQICDKKDIITVTKKINGGTNGMSDREIRYANATKILT